MAESKLIIVFTGSKLNILLKRVIIWCNLLVSFYVKMSNTEEDVVMESSNSRSGPSTPAAPSGPSTPMASNPGTPRSGAVETANTPPPAAIAQQHQVRNTPPPLSMTPQARNTPPPQGQAFLQGVGAQRQMQAHAQPQSKYTQLLAVIEDMGRDIRPTYSGSRTSIERLKRGIVHARILVRECLMECERAARS